MKTKFTYLLMMMALLVRVYQVAAQGTAFTYQGRLNDGTNSANGSYDLRFILYDNSVGGNQQGPILTNTATPVSAGLFTAGLDFGTNFPGAARWLEIGVRSNGGGGFFTLSPRQALTPAPYAITAGSLVSGGLTTGTYANALNLNNAGNSFNGTYNGSGVGLTGLNASQLGSGTVPDARLAVNVARTNQVWLLTGNAGANPTNGAFLGTIDNQPLELRVNGTRALRLEPILNNVNNSNTVNVIAGSPVNYVSNSVVGATIAGGGTAFYSGSGLTNSVTANFGTVGGGAGNTASGEEGATVGGGFENIAIGNSATVGGGIANTASSGAATVGGGDENIASSPEATVGGGIQNTASGQDATVGGGTGNNASSNDTTVGGGFANTANGGFATVSGGAVNQAQGKESTIPGGANNYANGDYSFAAGYLANANSTGSFVWADSTEVNSNPKIYFTSTAPNQFLIRATGGVGLGTAAPETPLHIADFHGITLGTSGTGGGYTALRMDLSAAKNGYAELQAIGQAGSSYGNLILQANGGNVGIGTTTPGALLQVGSATCNGTTWVNASDRNLKEDFTIINPRAVLDKVSALPITEWKYKTEAGGTEHIGPMAQDFHAAFDLNGADDKHIATVDEEGVALAAIQGLNQKLEETRSENAKLKQQNGLLAERLSELEAKVKQFAERK